jgi:hypothetical protein
MKRYHIGITAVSRQQSSPSQGRHIYKTGIKGSRLSALPSPDTLCVKCEEEIVYCDNFVRGK